MPLFSLFGLLFRDIIYVAYSCSVIFGINSVNFLESVDNREAETIIFNAAIRKECDINVRIAERKSVSNIALKYPFLLKIG